MAKLNAYKVTSDKPYTLVYISSSGLKYAQRIPKGNSIQASEVISRMLEEKKTGAKSKLEELMESGHIQMALLESADDLFIESTRPEKNRGPMKRSPKPVK